MKNDKCEVSQVTYDFILSIKREDAEGSATMKIYKQYLRFCKDHYKKPESQMKLNKAIKIKFDFIGVNKRHYDGVYRTFVNTNGETEIKPHEKTVIISR